MKSILFKILSLVAFIFLIFAGYVFWRLYVFWYHPSENETKGVIALVAVCIIIGVLKGILKALPHP